MTWCINDVTKIYGEAGLRKRGDEYANSEVPVIYPDNGPLPVNSQPKGPETIPTPNSQPAGPAAPAPKRPRPRPCRPRRRRPRRRRHRPCRRDRSPMGPMPRRSSTDGHRPQRRDGTSTRRTTSNRRYNVPPAQYNAPGGQYNVQPAQYNAQPGQYGVQQMRYLAQPASRVGCSTGQLLLPGPAGTAALYGPAGRLPGPRHRPAGTSYNYQQPYEPTPARLLSVGAAIG